MAGENDNDDNPFEGFIDHSDGQNVLHPADAAPADDAGDDNEEDQGNDVEDNEGDDGAGEEGSDDGDEEIDGDGDGDEDDARDDTDDSEDDGEDEGHAEEDDAVEPKKKRKLSPQQRINQMRRKAGDADRRAEAAEAENSALKNRLDAIEKKLTPGADDGNDGDEDGSSELQKPDVTDTEKYPYGELDSNYQEDLTEYRVDKKLAERDQKRETKEQEAVAEQETQAWQTKYTTKIEDGIAEYDDFDEVVVQGSENNEFPLTPETAMMALDSPVGHHVIYEIATNLKLAEKMAQMSLVEQAKQFGRLEARYENTKKPKPKLVPDTTPPPSRRKGGGGVKKFDASEGSFQDFEKHVNAQEKRRNRK